MALFTGLRTGRLLVSSALALACAIAVPLAAQKRQAPATRAPQKPPVKLVEVQAERAIQPGRRTPGSQDQDGFAGRTRGEDQRAALQGGPRIPREHRLRRANAFDGDLRGLPQTRPVRVERPEREGPQPNPVAVAVDPGTAAAIEAAAPSGGDAVAGTSIAAPLPSANFEGLDFGTWGNGHPPDTNGDVGPAYYIQSINTSLGIFDKGTGALIAAFTFNTFMSQGHFGNVCDTNNFGDPVILYDTFEDRWVVTDFAFVLSAGNVIPPALQCFAVSKSGDPIAGGWNFYSIETPGGLGDYPKFGIWPDGIYMSANMFGFPAGSPFQGAKLFALNKAQMYAGAASVQVVSFDAPPGDFTLLPANARLQTGTPPPGTPNYFLSTWLFTNALTVYKFHVDWNRISLSTFTGPDVPIAATSWPNATVPNAPSLGGNNLDVLQIRAMMQNQYSNISGTESLWATHTVRRQNTTGFAAPRWYQVNVTGGTVAAAIPQAATWDPDAANVIHRFMPSVAVNRQGDLALGYSTSSSTTKPAIKYAGRLAGDPINTFSQTEQTLIQGLGTQTGNCGGAVCTRWGDYSAMTLDTDGCTFWYTNMYYPVDGLNHHTRIGSFAFPGCTPAGTGSIQGTVTTTGGTPLPNATVALGSRSVTTDSNGFYVLSALPEGTYPAIAASLAGYSPQSFTAIAVTAGATTVRNFTIDPALAAACLVDTTQSDFQLGAATNCDLAASPDNVILLTPLQLDQQQLNNSGTGNVFNNTVWLGQTFVPALTGSLAKVDLSLFCSGCSGVNPPVIIEVRTTSAGLPTSTVLASVTIPGFSSGSSAFYTAAFPAPPALTAGTQYAYTIHSQTLRPTGVYAAIFSTTAGAYVNGNRVSSGDSGVTWTINTSAGTARDLAFKTYMTAGFAASGTFVSSLKDANPAVGATPTWLSINWTASVPAGTNLRFQAAASDSAFGPFTFVGPDGTAATFFSNGASLSQFNGKRYLKYRALLATTNPAATPVLNDVTICYEDVRTTTALAVDPASGPYNGTATLSATLTAGGAGLGGKSVTFSLNGATAGTVTTTATGEALLPNVSLAGITAGVYPGGVTASFAGDLGYTASTGANVLTVTKLPQAITFDPLPDRIATDPPFTLTATGGDSGNPVTFSTSSTACSVSGNEVTLLSAGTCAISADQAGNDNYEPAPTVTRTFSIGFASQTITFGALAAKTYGDPDFTVSATASSGLAVAFAAGGECTVTGATVHITGAGSCTITATQPGDARYSAADPAAQGFSIARAALLVKADDKTKLFNTPNPPLTGSVTGVVSPDVITATYSTPAVTSSPVGTYPIVPTINDPGGRLPNYDVTIVNGTLTILFASGGGCLGEPGHQVLPPIAANGSSVFNQNRTVPVKFRVCDAAGVSIGAPGVVQSFLLIQIIDGSTVTNVSLPPTSTTPDTAFRWDPTDRLWIFNLSTNPLSAGKRYVYRITLVDASTIDFSFTLR